MNQNRIREFQSNRVVWVWNDQHQRIGQSMLSWLQHLHDATVLPVCLLPHEYVYTYDGTANGCNCPSEITSSLNAEFRRQTVNLPTLSGKSLTCLFGDRIDELSRFSRRMGASVIAINRFQQSGFSRWIHGSLDDRLISRCEAKILFFEGSDDNNRGYDGYSDQSEMVPKQRSANGRQQQRSNLNFPS